MEERAKYMPLIYQKYKTLKPQHPSLFKEIEQREKFYLDMIYTLMTKNKIAEQRIHKAMEYIQSLEREVAMRRQFQINLAVAKIQQEEAKQETQRKYQTQQNMANNKINHVTFQSLLPKKETISSQTTIKPNMIQKEQKISQSIDRKQRRDIYLQDRPSLTHTTHATVIENPQPKPNPKPQLAQSSNLKQKQFKQEIIKNLIHQPIYTKKTYIQPDTESDKRSVSQNSLNRSRTEGKLSYEKYLSQKPPMEISPIYNIKRR